MFNDVKQDDYETTDRKRRRNHADVLGTWSYVLSTLVRGLEEKGFVGYKAYGNTYQYYPLISAKDYKRSALNDVIAHYYDNSFANVVSSFVEEEGMPLDELKELIARIENKRQA